MVVAVGRGWDESDECASVCRSNNAEFGDQTLLSPSIVYSGSMSCSSFGISICSSLGFDYSLYIDDSQI